MIQMYLYNQSIGDLRKCWLCCVAVQSEVQTARKAPPHQDPQYYAASTKLRIMACNITNAIRKASRSVTTSPQVQGKGKRLWERNEDCLWRIRKTSEYDKKSRELDKRAKESSQKSGKETPRTPCSLPAAVVTTLLSTASPAKYWVLSGLRLCNPE